MNILRFTAGVGLLAWCTVQFNEISAQVKPKFKPNVIIIVSDDIGYMDRQCYGADKVKTPNIDKLAKEGIKFNNFYSMPSSFPSYAALFTGCYPKRIGLVNSKARLNSAEMTIAKLVKQNNYATCMVGKWHLGEDSAYLPTKEGFDEFFGIPYPIDETPTDKLSLLEGTKVIETNPDQSQLTKRYTDRTVDFITKNSGSQFLVCLSLTNTHVPLAVSKDFAGKTKGGPFYDAITETDWAVGQITKALQKLAIDKTTIIIFTSTNGPNVHYGNHAGYAGGFKEGVNTIFEGGVRVPF